MLFRVLHADVLRMSPDMNTYTHLDLVALECDALRAEIYTKMELMWWKLEYRSSDRDKAVRR